MIERAVLRGGASDGLEKPLAMVIAPPVLVVIDPASGAALRDWESEGMVGIDVQTTRYLVATVRGTTAYYTAVGS